MTEVRVLVKLSDIENVSIKDLEDNYLELDLTKIYEDNIPYVSIIGDAETIEELQYSDNPILSGISKQYREGDYDLEKPDWYKEDSIISV